MTTDSTVFVAGGSGMVGSALKRRLAAGGYGRVLAPSRRELDLTDQGAVRRFYESERPDVVINAAALVGGIEANRSRPAEFVGLNLAIQQNVIWEAFRAGVGQLCFLGSSCIYPRLAEQPMREESMLTGALEPTNAPYAVAKIAGVTMCSSISAQYGRDYFSVLPCNLYGTGDNYDPAGSHVMAAMIRRFHEALPDTDVVCWGSGSPVREFLDVDDAADAIVFLCEAEGRPDLVNVGSGVGVSIRELAETVQKVVGHRGAVAWDTSKPDGFPAKVNDVSKLRGMGWSAKVGLEEGVGRAYRWFLANVAG